MLLTVLMPVFDSGKYLEKSVSSILNQTFSDFEFLIINDGSTDDSLDILSKFSDRRIRIESNDCNRGLIYTLNRGVELAQGQYIARMDSDDIAHPKRLELQMNFLLKHLDVVMCGASHIGFNGVSKRKQYFPLDYEDIKAEALFNSPFSHPLVIIKSSVMKQFHYDEQFIYAEDYFLWQQIIPKYKVVNLPCFLYFYRTNHGSQTATAMKNAKKRFLIISSIQKIALEKLNIINNDTLSKLHYFLSQSDRIKMLDLEEYSVNDILDYFHLLLFNNKNTTYCSKWALRRILGRLLLKLLIYRWSDLTVLDKWRLMSSSLFYNGVCGIFINRIRFVVYESFANGEATFLLGGDWCSSGVENINPDLDYGIAPMVKGKTEATVLGGWTWNINTNCKDPELAYDLIQYLNSEKGDSLLGVEGKISARKDFDYDKALEGNDKLKVFTEEFPYTEARPAVINEKSIDELITNAILEVDYGQSSAEDALTSLTQKLNENIASNYQ